MRINGPENLTGRTLSNQLLSQRVYNWLLERILSSEFKPGHHINRRDIAEQVGVSVAPALEAMVQLEWEGFLETRPRLGTRVRTVTLEEIHGRFLLREALEAQGARMYCGDAVRHHEKHLLKLASKVDRSNPFNSRNWQLEIDFHRALILLTECQVLINTFDQVMRHSLFYAMNQLLPPPSKKRVPDSHSRLVASLQTNNLEEADRAIRSHIRSRWLDDKISS